MDACIGGWVLPWWGDVDQPWDLAVPGVTSISADLHKFGYAPKGASVVLYRARERHHAQYFATTAWPGYPVVNPTMLGSRGAGSMAAAWAVLQVLGTDGLAELVACHAPGDRPPRRGGRRGPRAAGRRRPDRSAASRSPRTTPLPAAEQVDPFLLIDEVRRRGFLLQAQPAMVAAGRLGPAAHRPPHRHGRDARGSSRSSSAALVAAADAVRGLPAAVPDPSLAGRVLTEGLPDELAGVMATLEALPGEVVHPLLIAVLAAAIDPARE